MKLHELEIEYDELVDITVGRKTFIIRSDVLNFQVGDLIHFINDTFHILNDIREVALDVYTLYRIIYIFRDESCLKDGYYILGIKRVEIK